MAHKPEIKEKKERKKRTKEKEQKRTHGGKEEEKRQKTKTLSEKKEEARNVNEQRDKDWRHVICVHNTIHSADNNTAGQQTLTNYPTQRKNERSR